MPLATILKSLSAATLSRALAKSPLRGRARPPLWGIVLFGLVLSVGGSNRFFRQVGASVALMTGGAALALVIQEDRQLAAIHQLRTGHKRREAALKTSLDMAMAEAEALAAQLTQMNAGLANWQTGKVLVAGQLETLEHERWQLLCELYETAIAEATLQLDISKTQVRITALEAALAAKTNLATQMLTELEAEATGTFNHFSAKVSTQSQLINDLHQQIEVLQKTNTALTDKSLTGQPFKRTGPDNLMSHRLFDYLAQN